MSDDTDTDDPSTVMVDLIADTEEFVEGLQAARDELHKTREAAEALAEALDEVDEAGDIDVDIKTGEAGGAFESALKQNNF